MAGSRLVRKTLNKSALFAIVGMVWLLTHLWLCLACVLLQWHQSFVGSPTTITTGKYLFVQRS